MGNAPTLYFNGKEIIDKDGNVIGIAQLQKNNTLHPSAVNYEVKINKEQLCNYKFNPELVEQLEKAITQNFMNPITATPNTGNNMSLPTSPISVNPKHPPFTPTPKIQQKRQIGLLEQLHALAKEDGKGVLLITPKDKPTHVAIFVGFDYTTKQNVIHYPEFDGVYDIPIIELPAYWRRICHVVWDNNPDKKRVSEAILRLCEHNYIANGIKQAFNTYKINDYIVLDQPQSFRYYPFHPIAKGHFSEQVGSWQGVQIGVDLAEPKKKDRKLGKKESIFTKWNREEEL